MPGTNLTREEAATRAALVTVDQHDVELDVTTGPETFSTRSTITFTCAQPGAETFLDFVGATVEAVSLNGTDLDPAELYADRRVGCRGWPPRTSSSSRPPAATRTPARACTASSTRSTTRSTSTASSRCPTAAGCTPCSSSPTSRPGSPSR